jgi:hypothetical protein
MKIYKNKGQAALEFMMTYGWAIMVVLGAIGALAYFGILNPGKFTPETCFATSGFSCSGRPVVGTNNVSFTIINGVGYAVTFSNSSVEYSSALSGCGDAYFCPRGDVSCGASSRPIEDGASATITLVNCDFSKVNAVKGEMTIHYQNTMSKLQESVIFTVTGKTKNS